MQSKLAQPLVGPHLLMLPLKHAALLGPRRFAPLQRRGAIFLCLLLC